MALDPELNDASCHARQLQDLLLATEGVTEFLDQLVHVAVTTMDGDLSVGLTMARDGHPATVASDQAASQYDEVQYGYDEGPCLTAMRSGQTVMVEDLVEDDRFGSYRGHALAMGVRSSLSLPLSGGDHAVGALNLYSRRPGAFGPVEQSDGRRFADEASRALTLAMRMTRHEEINEQLRAALTSRTVIDQALGVIMAQNRCDADAAFDVLRTVSQNRNVKLHTVATEIVTAVSNGPPGTGRRFQD